MRVKLAQTIALLASMTVVCAAQIRSQATPPPSSPSYIVTNDDAPALYGDNSISFYEAGGTPTVPALSYQNSVTVGGTGGAGGNFAANQLVSDSNAQCLYASSSASGQIASVNLQTQLTTGIFAAMPLDTGTLNGMGLALNGNYLYAT